MHILIIDDHPLTCQGLSALLINRYPDAVVRTTNTAQDARGALQQTPQPDWLFLDIKLQDDPEHRLFHELCNTAWIDSTILISAEPEHRLIRTALASGARGFIPKAALPEQVLDGFAAILAGEFYMPSEVAAQLQQLQEPGTNAAQMRGLSPRLSQVHKLLLRGASNKVIANDLSLSAHTVKEYVSSVLAFHDVHSRLELVLKFNA
jgi:two-component system, NarL family, nitrate/nitrite response regulator NarL